MTFVSSKPSLIQIFRPLSFILNENRVYLSHEEDKPDRIKNLLELFDINSQDPEHHSYGKAQDR